MFEKYNLLKKLPEVVPKVCLEEHMCTKPFIGCSHEHKRWNNFFFFYNSFSQLGDKF